MHEKLCISCFCPADLPRNILSLPQSDHPPTCCDGDMPRTATDQPTMLTSGLPQANPWFLLQETSESFQLRHLSLSFNCDCKCWAIFQANEGICGAGSLFNAVFIVTSALPHVGQDITKKICCGLYLILEFMCIHVLAMQVVASDF